MPTTRLVIRTQLIAIKENGNEQEIASSERELNPDVTLAVLTTIGPAPTGAGTATPLPPTGGTP